MLQVIGGSYREICLHPRWDELFGSGMRAAVAISEILQPANVELLTWVEEDAESDYKAIASTFGIKTHARRRAVGIEFQYDHALAPPRQYPNQLDIVIERLERIETDKALVFSLIESQTPIASNILVYDPQAGRKAVPPSEAGHTASRLAIVANLSEVEAMLRGQVKSVDGHRATTAGTALLEQEGCEVVVVKNGVEGATVITRSGTSLVPSFAADRVFPIGSGDVFSGVFSACWMELGMSPEQAALSASASTAYYCASRSLPIPADLNSLIASMKPASTRRLEVDRAIRRVYLAGPLFTMSQIWLLNEAKRCLEEQGVKVFSPKDEVGYLDDPAATTKVAKADLAGLESSDLVFAILDGLDPGTLFEVGYAVKKGIPVVGFAEQVEPGQLTVLIGTDCKLYNEFPSAVYQAGWVAANL